MLHQRESFTSQKWKIKIPKHPQHQFHQLLTNPTYFVYISKDTWTFGPTVRRGFRTATADRWDAPLATARPSVYLGLAAAPLEHTSERFAGSRRRVVITNTRHTRNYASTDNVWGCGCKAQEVSGSTRPGCLLMKEVNDFLLETSISKFETLKIESKLERLGWRVMKVAAHLNYVVFGQCMCIPSNRHASFANQAIKAFSATVRKTEQRLYPSHIHKGPRICLFKL